MTVPYTFATDTGTIPLAHLDANFSSVANNVSTANTVVSSAQPTITSVGTLTALTVTGAVTGSQFVGSGNTLNNIQGANVVGAVATATNSTQANYANTANAVVGSNVSGIVAQASQASYANTANAVAGSNVSGVVAQASQANYANTANAVAGSNVSGVVSQATQANYANVATYANTANAVAGSNVSGQVANALVAGTVYTAAQPNITSVGLLTSVSSSGNIITTANINGGNVNSSGIVSATGNITGANLNVGSGNVNVGNIVFALDNSKFRSAKWTLVESFTNLNNYFSGGYSNVTMTQTFSYYSTNYNEFMIKLSPVLTYTTYFLTNFYTNIPLNTVASGDKISIGTTWNHSPGATNIEMATVSWANVSTTGISIYNPNTGAGDYPSTNLYIYAR